MLVLPLISRRRGERDSVLAGWQCARADQDCAKTLAGGLILAPALGTQNEYLGRRFAKLRRENCWDFQWGRVFRGKPEFFLANCSR